MASTPRRPTHRKRISALRLSSDTTSTLPEYIPTSGWHSHHQSQQSRRDSSILAEEEEAIPSDKPPDYPDSAEEADEDTDSESNVVYLPQFPSPANLSQRPHTASPRRAKRFLPTHKRRLSYQRATASEPSDPYLDSLLERSVHALEMSNTLLQSSISTQTSLNTVLASDSRGDSTLEAHAINLSSRIKNTWDSRAAWVDDLEEITRDVEGLFGGSEAGPSTRRHRPLQESPPSSSLLLEGSSGISCSLPSSNSFSSNRSKRRPSLDLRQASDSTTPRLNLTPHNRVHLVAPAPRALTQYVESTQDTEAIMLPSTIGLRALPSVHHTPDWKQVSEFASSSTTSLLSQPTFSTTPCLPPKLTDKPLEPSTPAYNMLSSFVYRAPSSGSATPSTSFKTSFMANMANIRRNSREGNNSTERSGRGRESPSPISQKSGDRVNCQECCSRSSTSSRTPKRGESPMAITVHRPMTPPVEESSSSSSDGYVAKLTMQSLRKILDDQPSPAPTEDKKFLKPPQFLPRTPAPVAEAGTSTATASISRLFTKGTHSSSTRAPSPPRLSAMKHSRNNSTNNSANGSVAGGSAPPTPSATHSFLSPSPTSLSIPDMVSKVLGSASSSGRSTPNKHISFAQLPESYASTRPGGAGSSKFKEKHNRRKRKSSGGKLRDVDGHIRTGSNSSLDGGLGGWWNGWMMASGAASAGGPGGLSLNLARQQERMEDRMTRSFGGRMNAGFSNGGMDEWAV